MDNLGELFGGLGEMFGGVAEAGGEGIAFVAAQRIGGSQGEGDDATSTYDRTLAGRRRILNVNDL